jgi:3',5'-cyclic AMP phosphodiesterase CpdA
MPEQLKLAVIGDPHVAIPRGENDNRLEIDPGRKLHGLSVELLSATVEAINAEPGISATLVLGDLTRDSELFNHEVARTMLSRLSMPLYIVLGNHDLVRERPEGIGYEGEKRLEREEVIEFYGRACCPNGLSHYVVELDGGVMLIVLDSNRSFTELMEANEPLTRQEDGWIGPQQLSWLEGVLQQVTSAGRLPLVALHHTLLEQSPAERNGHMLRTAFRQWRLLDSAPVLELLSKYRAPLALSGHLHVQSVNSQDGVSNLVTSASVSYPHAWRLLTVANGAIYAEARRLASVPSCPNLQEQSRVWMAQGMADLIRARLHGMPLIGGMASDVVDFVVRTDWWPRFCDGTLAGFHIDKADIPNGNPIASMMFNQVAGMLNEYGTWKAARPEPNRIEFPFAPCASASG